MHLQTKEQSPDAASPAIDDHTIQDTLEHSVADVRSGISPESSSLERMQPQQSFGAEQRLVEPAAASSNAFDFSIAVKADNAETPIFIWDNRIWGLGSHSPHQRQTFRDRFQGRCPLTALRSFALARWRQRLTRSFIAYMRSCYGDAWASCEKAKKEREVGRDCFHRVTLADWWEMKGRL